MSLLKLFYIVAGTASLSLGLIGIVVPGLPTTPFLLLTAALYMRSSNKLYNRLIANKHLGPYILNYRKNKGLTLRSKMYAIVLQWIMITVSVIWGIEKAWAVYMVILAGFIGTSTILFIIPTVKTVK
jgi:uncharacterized protein